jgi:RCR-type E3 ubiquitin transferase
LGESPCLVLAKCQHIFHWKCLRLVLEQKWPSGPRISFRFIQCPLCKIEIEHPALEDLLSPLRQLQADVAQKARMRLEYEGLLNNAAGSSAASNLLDDQKLEWI